MPEDAPPCATCGRVACVSWCPTWEVHLCVHCKETRAGVEVWHDAMPALEFEALMNRPLTGEFTL